jgi:hypothetical protein
MGRPAAGRRPPAAGYLHRRCRWGLGQASWRGSKYKRRYWASPLLRIDLDMSVNCPDSHRPTSALRALLQPVPVGGCLPPLIRQLDRAGPPLPNHSPPLCSTSADFSMEPSHDYPRLWLGIKRERYKRRIVCRAPVGVCATARIPQGAAGPLCLGDWTIAQPFTPRPSQWRPASWSAKGQGIRHRRLGRGCVPAPPNDAVLSMTLNCWARSL